MYTAQAVKAKPPAAVTAEMDMCSIYANNRQTKTPGINRAFCIDLISERGK